MLKRSRFLKTYFNGDTARLYHTLTMEVVETNRNQLAEVGLGDNADCDHIQEDTPFAQLLIMHNFLIAQDDPEEMLLDHLRSACFTGPNIQIMVLHMTDQCNLRCRYCFIEGGQPVGYVREVMSENVAKAAIDKFFSIRHRPDWRPSIVFYGGEPLLNWSVIEKIVPYGEQKATELGVDLDLVMITNGTLLTQQVAKFIKDHRMLVSVSLDGPEACNDSNRINVNGEGSYSQTVAGIALLKEQDVPFSVSCVLAKNNVERWDEIYTHLVEDLGVEALGFNHISIIPGFNEYDPAYEIQYAKAVLGVQESIQKSNRNVYERRMGHKIACFLDRHLNKADCTGCGEQISVSPQGEIGVCQGYMGSRKTFTHTVFEPNYDPADDPVFQDWSRRSPLNMEQCLACEALATCGGGCPRNADMLSGSHWNIDEAFCEFAKRANEWLVWRGDAYRLQS